MPSSAFPSTNWFQNAVVFLRGEVSARLAGTRLTRPSAIPGAEAWMVFGMRVLLALSALLTLYIEPDNASFVDPWSRLTFIGYSLHSLVLLCVARWRAGFWHGKVIYWLDIAWYGLMVQASGGASSPFFTLCFFAILAVSFRHGFDSGAKLTLGSTAIVTLAVLIAPAPYPAHLLLLRATFMLAFGYMIAFWGGLLVDQQRRLALLRDVSRLSNPRFGVQHTLDSLMEKILRFYGASNCVLLMQDSGGRWMLNTVHHPHSGRPTTHTWTNPDALQPMLTLGDDRVVWYPGARRVLAGAVSALAQTSERPSWHAFDGAACAQIADLLDAHSFISAALPLRKGAGRIFVTASQGLRRGDASFLSHIVQQAFPVIETINLLDRLASEAAFRERQTIARDLHDSTIQPYIGLRHALAAVRSRAGDDHALAAELDRLLDMSTNVIGEMRNFAQRFRNGRQEEPELLIALRRQLGQVRAFYDVEVTLDAQAAPRINDRLAAEVFQIVTEGVSNICKHTRARSACVRLADDNGQLAIDILNPAEECSAPFIPRSLAERVRGLGGTLVVEPQMLQTRLRIRVPA